MKPFNAVEFQQYFIARTGYTGEDGFEVMLPVAEADAMWRHLASIGVKPIGLGAVIPCGWKQG
jgi:aminomethyltransferase (EC 2.1.2.10)